MITRGIIVEGKVQSSGDIIVEGEVHGDIHAKGDIAITKSGLVSGNIYTNNIVIEGRVTGEINAQSLVTLTSTSAVEANITATRVVRKKGSELRGELVLRPDEKAATKTEVEQTEGSENTEGASRENAMPVFKRIRARRRSPKSPPRPSSRALKYTMPAIGKRVAEGRMVA